MDNQGYLLGSPVEVWREGEAKIITFIVTEDCNLVCKYCYITGKNQRNKMSFETAKKAVDYILGHPEEFPEKSVVWDFIGGEPLLEIELIDRICDYIKTEMYRLNHKWFENYRFYFSSNGVLYHTPQTQRFIEKNYNNLGIGLSVDGNKTKHDLQRVKPDGSGSYDDVVKNVPLWVKQFPEASTKATFSSADLAHVKDSIISLWNLGIRNVNANVIFENDWQRGDDLLFETQLKELADYILENRLWSEYNCSFFTDSVGFPIVAEAKKQNWCGAGKMLAIDYRGKFFPCVRFVGYSLNKREEYIIGDIENGFDHAKLRPFMALNLLSQSTDECINCQVGSGCGWCQGFNYDEAKIDTIFERMTYICGMHKARVRANDYYWNRLQQEYSIERRLTNPRQGQLYFILANDTTRHCAYQPKSDSDIRMSVDVFCRGLEYANKHFYTPVLLLPRGETLTSSETDLLKGQSPVIIHDGSAAQAAMREVVVYDGSAEAPVEGVTSILLLKPDRIAEISNLVKDILQTNYRVNLILEEMSLFTNEHLEIYEKELTKVADYLVQMEKQGISKEINVLTDRIYLKKMANCNAGVDCFTLAPNGKFYLCPGFYFDAEANDIGSLETGVDFNYQEHLTLEKSPVCSECDAYHCKRCIYQNRKITREYLVPDRNQCIISHVERRVSKYYAEKMVENNLIPGLTSAEVEKHYPELDYMDPLDKLIARKY